MEAEAQISRDSNTQFQPEPVVSVQKGDPGVSSSVANAVIPQQPGLFCASFLFLIYWAVEFDTCSCWDGKLKD